jgi:hypothetical protein
MANRYWVGGTNSWNNITGTKWAATSGGAGGQSIPTTADDVFFDASSGASTVTIATGNTGAKSINCTGFTGTITGTSGITVAGAIMLSTGMGYSHTGTVTISGTGTLTTSGKAFSNLAVSGAGITVTLGDALNVGIRNVNVIQGTLNTANYSVTCASFDISGSTTRTVTLGSSALSISASSLSAFNAVTTTNLAFNAGTSQVNMTSSGGGIAAPGLSFNDISFTSTATGSRSLLVGSCNNVTLTASASGLSQLSVRSNFTVNGTLTCSGSSVSARGFVRSDVIGTTRTVTAAAISADDCDFRHIALAGAAAGASPVRAGDCGGNSGITFPAAKNVYRVGSNTTFVGVNSWALSSGGGGSDNNFPLAQDTYVLDNGATPATTLGIAAANYNLGALDCSNRTNAITIGYNGVSTWYGSHTYSSAVTVSGVSTQTFSGRGTMDFTSAGKNVTFPITIDAQGGTFRLADAFNSSNSITLDRGTFNANNYNVTGTLFDSNGTTARTLTMGSGLWTITGTGSVWNISTATGLTFNKDTANILLSNTLTSSVSFASGPLTYNKLTIGGGASTSTVNINSTVGSTSGSFSELASTRTGSYTVQLGTSTTAVIGTWSITGSPGNAVTITSNSAGSRRTFTLTNVTSGINYLDVKDIGELSGNKFYVGPNSLDSGNNSNVYFTNPPSPAAATGNMLMLF